MNRRIRSCMSRCKPALRIREFDSRFVFGAHIVSLPYLVRLHRSRSNVQKATNTACQHLHIGFWRFRVQIGKRYLHHSVVSPLWDAHQFCRKYVIDGRSLRRPRAHKACALQYELTRVRRDNSTRHRLSNTKYDPRIVDQSNPPRWFNT